MEDDLELEKFTNYSIIALNPLLSASQTKL